MGWGHKTKGIVYQNQDVRDHCLNEAIMDYPLNFLEHAQKGSASMCQTNPFHLHHHAREMIPHYHLRSQYLQDVPCHPAMGNNEILSLTDYSSVVHRNMQEFMTTAITTTNPNLSHKHDYKKAARIHWNLNYRTLRIEKKESLKIWL